MTDSASTRSAILLFAGGAVIGGAIAFGAAYGFASYYARQLDDRSKKERIKDKRCGNWTCRCPYGGVVLCCCVWAVDPAWRHRLR
jgi:hypothetical protein